MIDPIDGTKNFVRGVPVWATLIALMVNDQVVVGVVSAPALGRRWWASLGGGAYAGKSLMSASEIHVSDVAAIEDASLSYASISAWVEAGQGQQFVDLLRACWRTRAYGDFWSYMLLAEGGVDIACEPELALHDMAACSVIVTEAGGRFTDLDGRPARSAPGRTRPTAACTTRCWPSSPRRLTSCAGLRAMAQVWAYGSRPASARKRHGAAYSRTAGRSTARQNDRMDLTHGFSVPAVSRRPGPPSTTWSGGALPPRR